MCFDQGYINAAVLISLFGWLLLSAIMSALTSFTFVVEPVPVPVPAVAESAGAVPAGAESAVVLSFVEAVLLVIVRLLVERVVELERLAADLKSSKDRQ